MNEDNSRRLMMKKLQTPLKENKIKVHYRTLSKDTLIDVDICI